MPNIAAITFQPHAQDGRTATLCTILLDAPASQDEHIQLQWQPDNLISSPKQVTIPQNALFVGFLIEVPTLQLTAILGNKALEVKPLEVLISDPKEAGTRDGAVRPITATDTASSTTQKTVRVSN